MVCPSRGCRRTASQVGLKFRKGTKYGKGKSGYGFTNYSTQVDLTNAVFPTGKVIPRFKQKPVDIPERNTPANGSISR